MDIDILKLQAKAVKQWTVSEVALWLSCIDMGEYKSIFIENSVSGFELDDLTEEDLLSMGISKLGHRKKIIRKVKDVMANNWDTSSTGSDVSIGSGGSNRSTNSTGSSGSTKSISLPQQKEQEWTVKCCYKDEIVSLFLKKLSIKELEKKIKNEFEQKVSIKYKDSDGDLITLRTDEQLASAFKDVGEKGILRIILKSKIEGLGKTETGLLENLVDGVVVSDTKGRMIFVNKAAEKIFGYDRKEMLKKNVSILIPAELARVHSKYIKTYMETGKAHIVGIGRNVTGKRKDGSLVELYLSLAENKGRGFTSTMRLLSDRSSSSTLPSFSSPSSSTSSSTTTTTKDFAFFSLLQNLLDVAVVTNERGIILFANKEATKTFGFENFEMVGKNVKMLMPSPFSEEHDSYLENYIRTKVPKVIGKGRDVVAQHKDGSVLPVHLSLSEQVADGTRLFTAIIRKIEETVVTSQKSVLQQERELIEHIIIPSIIIDEKGTINAINKQGMELFGYKLMEVLGKNIKMLMTGEDRENHDEYMRLYLSDPQRQATSKVVGVGRDVIAIHKDGSILNVRLSVTKKQDSKKIYFTGIFQQSV